MIIDLKDLAVREAQHYLQHAIAPRPICFASTVNQQGEINLSPFSFFNVFSSNPPIVVFSPSRRARNNTVKDTFTNITDIPEVGINIVDYDMVHQMSLASCEYPADVNEFEKAGFTMESATIIRPPLVKESKIKMECRVTNLHELGDQGGAGILVVAEVINMHLKSEILDENQHIDPLRIRQVARLGGDYYIDAKPEYLFKIPKPIAELGIGVDNLPQKVLRSNILTGNHRGQLANVAQIPLPDDQYNDPISQSNKSDQNYANRIAGLLDEGKVVEAWQVVLRWIA